MLATSWPRHPGGAFLHRQHHPGARDRRHAGGILDDLPRPDALHAGVKSFPVIDAQSITRRDDLPRGDALPAGGDALPGWMIFPGSDAQHVTPAGRSFVASITPGRVIGVMLAAFWMIFPA